MRSLSLVMLGLLTLSTGFIHRSDQVDLQTAQRRGLEWSVIGNDNSTHYDFPLQISMINKSREPMEVLIPVGSMFAPGDSDYQDIIIGEEYLVRVEAGEEKELDLRGYCTQSSDIGPSGEVHYFQGPGPDPLLLGLIGFVSENKLHGMEAQQAVWAVADRSDLRSVVGYREEFRSQIVGWLADQMGVEAPPPPEEDDYLRNYEAPPVKRRVGGNFSFEFSYPASFRIAMFNGRNTVVRELMPETRTAPGLHEFPFEFDATYFEEDVYTFKLIANGEAIIERRLDLRRN